MRAALAAVAAIILCVVGFASFTALTVRELPSVDPPVVGISTTYRGASAEVIEERITELIERQVDQMTRLVEDLMDLTQIRSGQLRLQRERIDLCALVAQSAQTVELTMQQRSHRLTLSAPDAPVFSNRS